MPNPGGDPRGSPAGQMHVGERAARPGRPLPVADPPAAAPAENAGSAVMAAALTDSPLPPARMSGPDLASSAPFRAPPIPQVEEYLAGVRPS